VMSARSSSAGNPTSHMLNVDEVESTCLLLRKFLPEREGRRLAQAGRRLPMRSYLVTRSSGQERVEPRARRQAVQGKILHLAAAKPFSMKHELNSVGSRDQPYHPGSLDVAGAGPRVRVSSDWIAHRRKP